MRPTILIIEDDPMAAKHVAAALRAAWEAIHVAHAPTLREGVRRAAGCDVDCVLLDYRLPDGNGLDGLRAIRHARPRLPVVLMTGAGSEEIAVEAMKLGAADYVVKQGAFPDRLPAIVRDALLATTVPSPGEHTSQPSGPSADVRAQFRSSGLLGESEAFQASLAALEHALGTDAIVLIEGESGTGKELAARAIHRGSARANGPFVAVDCAAVPEALAERQFFGHVRGAFAGADRDQRGFFQLAARGTLLLDDIAGMPVALQSKLVRAIQDREIRPVGSAQARRIDVRIIAATNENLRAAVAAGSFRADLYHRLAVLRVQLPPLRERRGDAALIARELLAFHASREEKGALRLAPEALRAVEHYAWPGNVRELENEMYRLAVCATPGATIRVADLHPDIRDATHACHTRDDERPLRDIVRDVELVAIAARLRRYGYNRTRAAVSLGITREGLWNKLRILGLKMRPADGRREP